MNKSIIFMLILMGLLIACIILMGVSLLLSERAFGQVSSYIAIASIVVTLVGVVIIIRSDRHHKNH